jgi:hypothetical protein
MTNVLELCHSSQYVSNISLYDEKNGFHKGCVGEKEGAGGRGEKWPNVCMHE